MGFHQVQSIYNRIPAAWWLEKHLEWSESQWLSGGPIPIFYDMEVIKNIKIMIQSTKQMGFNDFMVILWGIHGLLGSDGI